MNDPLPNRLKPVREILMDSAHGPADDEPPMPPDDLLDDLEEKLAGTTPHRASPAKPSFFERVRRAFATPAFGVVAALVVVLFIAVPLVNPGGFRSTGGEVSDGPSVILLGIDDTTYAAVQANASFDANALKRVATAVEAEAIPAPKIIADFAQERVRAIDAAGNQVHDQPFSGDGILSDIAPALSKLAPAADQR
ncbi:MAG: hypothetical protein AAGB14_07890 [Verrucomicrobiota bacterium]